MSGGAREGPHEDTASGWEARSYAGMVRLLEAIASGSGGIELTRHEGLVAAVSSATPDSALFNFAVYESPQSLEQHLGGLAESYAGVGVNVWAVWAPEEDANSERLLRAAGHQLGAGPRRMSIDLEQIPEPDDELKLAKSIDWSQLCEINDAASELEQGTFESGTGARPGRGLHVCAAYHEGFLASTLATLDTDGDCLVSFIATLPEARGNGLAGSLLHRALIQARARGCSSSSLQASGSGAPVYARLGYRDLGGIGIWERHSGPAS